MKRNLLPWLARPNRSGLNRLLCALLVLCALAPSFAQPADPTQPRGSDVAQPLEANAVQLPDADAEPLPGTDAESVADAAVNDWLTSPSISIDRLSALGPEELCRELPGLVTRPPPPAGTTVRLDDRLEQPSEDPSLRVFTYAAVRPGDQLDVVEVRVRQTDAGWLAERVGFRSLSELSGVRAWLQTPSAAWAFIALTLLVALALFRTSSLLRRGLGAAMRAVREHRRLVVVTLVGLYALFGLGALSGSQLPESCDEAILEVLDTAITSVGATAAYGSGDVPRAAATTFYQNFVVVTVSVTFTLALLFGVPAYLFAGFSFFVQGVPFGLLAGGGLGEYLMLGVLLLLELTAYFIVVAGGGMLLSTVWRRGLGAYGIGLRKLVSMLSLALVLLLVGAWYEAAVIILGT